MPKEKNLIKVAEPRIQKTNIKRRRKKKPEIELKSIGKFLVSIIILLAILLVIESTQIFLQFKKTIVQRPVYMAVGQPIDIDAYLREYFANTIPKKTMHVTITAYSSTNGQTDGTPYLTAVGTPVRDGIVAANFLPIGTVVRFPDKFGEKIFVVEDRMNEKYGLQVDIWMSNQEEAKKFGIQYLKMEIF